MTSWEEVEKRLDNNRSYTVEEVTGMLSVNDKGKVMSCEITCDSPSVFSINTESCRFYRAEVFDATRELRIAIGNPIWNDIEE